jgi:SAM-dependent methyltransferase
MSETRDKLKAAYEEVPYPGVADSHSHLRCLQAIALLYGIPAPDITSCRVLELGCASGRNLLPQAVEYPGSRFLGIDFSPAQIADGHSLIEALAVQNVELRHARIEDVDGSWGMFDYIVCPGVFSWVQQETQQCILRICRENLAPQGVAMVSFNAYPGWHFQSVLRDLLRYHVAPFSDRGRQITEARAMLEFIAENCRPESSQGRVFRRDRDYLRTVLDDYLYHEYLVDENNPLYFHQFVEQAESHGLQFVSDMELSKMSGTFATAAVQRVLANTPLIQQCQLLDFLRNESFHKTLLCHREIALHRRWQLQTIRSLSLALAETPTAADIDVASRDPIELDFPQGKLTTSEPLGKAAIARLIDVYPGALSLEALHADALALLPPEVRAALDGQDEGRDVLAGAMLGLLQAGLLRVFLHPPVFCRTVSQRPLAKPLTRLLARRRTLLTNELHENVRLDDFQYGLLARLDGTRTPATLSEEMEPLAASGTVTAGSGEKAISEVVDRVLKEFCAKALLVA